MRKVVNSKKILASTALAASLAIFGCTTNKMPGDGQPSSMPYNSPATSAPTNGTSGGTRPGTAGELTPMISSGPASMTTRSVDAYAVVANEQGFRGRILGPSLPGQSDIAASLQPTGQFQNPALVANPEVTVNRSISSEPTPAYINDSGAGIAVTTGVTSAAIVAAASPSQIVIGTPTPTQSSIGIPSPAVAANPATAVHGNRATMTTSAAITSPSTTKSRAVGNLTVPSAVHLTTTSNGTPMITNAK